MMSNRAKAGLVGVAVAYGLVQLLVVRRVPLGFDEAVYLSQVNPRVPTLFFSAPRARGVTLVVLPLVWVTSSVSVLREYLSVVSAACLVGAYWPWLRVTGERVVVPLAAVAFAGLWVTQFYGAAVMPNLYVAFGTVAAVGWFLRHTMDGERRALAGIVAGVAVVMLMRPGDGFWLAVVLFGAVAVVPAWRRPVLPVAVAAGLVIGGAEWVVEAVLRYGGVAERLRRSSEIEGGLGWHPGGLLMQLRTLDGPLLCRPCHAGPPSGGPAGWATAIWWLGVPVLTVGGIVLAARAGRGAQAALPAACGAALALPYTVLVGYAAPRFLLPAYALLSLPVAQLLAWPFARAGKVGRVVMAVAAMAVGLHLLSQQVVLRHRTGGDAGYPAVAARLRELGIRSPCTLSGRDAFPVAYYAGCRGEQTSGHNVSITVGGLVRRAAQEPTAILTRGGRPPRYADGWRPTRITSGRHGWIAYQAP